MTVLVTGAAGHLGATLVRALLRDGRAVRAMVRGEAPSSLTGLPVELVRGDVLDPASLDAAMRGVEVVYHLAAFVSIYPSDAAKLATVNIEGPRYVTAAALAHGVRRLVHFSSIHALSPPEGDGVTDESRPPNLDPDAPAYDRSKANGEAEVRAAVERGLDAVIVNPTGVLGPYSFRPQLHLRLMQDLYHRSLPSLVPGGFDWVDVRDVVQGAMAAENRGRTGERYLLSGRWASVRELAETVAGVTGRAPPRLTVPMWMARMGVPFAAAWAAITGVPPLYTAPSLRALHEHRHTDNQRARRELGFNPRPLVETIADTFVFNEQVGLLEPGATVGRPLTLEEDRLTHAAP